MGSRREVTASFRGTDAPHLVLYAKHGCIHCDTFEQKHKARLFQKIRNETVFEPTTVYLDSNNAVHRPTYLKTVPTLVAYHPDLRPEGTICPADREDNAGVVNYLNNIESPSQNYRSTLYEIGSRDKKLNDIMERIIADSEKPMMTGLMRGVLHAEHVNLTTMSQLFKLWELSTYCLSGDLFPNVHDFTETTHPEVDKTSPEQNKWLLQNASANNELPGWGWTAVGTAGLIASESAGVAAVAAHNTLAANAAAPTSAVLGAAQHAVAAQIVPIIAVAAAGAIVANQFSRFRSDPSFVFIVTAFLAFIGELSEFWHDHEYLALCKELQEFAEKRAKYLPASKVAEHVTQTFKNLVDSYTPKEVQHFLQTPSHRMWYGECFMVITTKLIVYMFSSLLSIAICYEPERVAPVSPDKGIITKVSADLHSFIADQGAWIGNAIHKYTFTEPSGINSGALILAFHALTCTTPLRMINIFAISGFQTIALKREKLEDPKDDINKTDAETFKTVTDYGCISNTYKDMNLSKDKKLKSSYDAVLKAPQKYYRVDKGGLFTSDHVTTPWNVDTNVVLIPLFNYQSTHLGKYNILRNGHENKKMSNHNRIQTMDDSGRVMIVKMPRGAPQVRNLEAWLAQKQKDAMT